MTYSEALDFLYSLRMFGVKFGLGNTRKLSALVQEPQEKLQFIHVAGTNGKGSSCAMLDGIYRTAGLRVGLYTSPHLVSFTERIQINRQPISKTDAARLAAELRESIASEGSNFEPTFFELVTVMALKYFVEQQCDLVIWETGLGGRLDATNIVTPLASVITNVQLDHQKWLGETIREIAGEKAGIIKPGIPVVSGADDPIALSVIQAAALANKSPLYLVTKGDAEAVNDFEIGLAGQHQRLNAALVCKVVRILQNKIPVTDSQLREGLASVHWPGRCQVIERNRQTILLDGAHNPDGAVTLAAEWKRRFGIGNATLVLGILEDKSCAEICAILAPIAKTIYLAPVASDRTEQPEVLRKFCAATNPTVNIVLCPNLSEALEQTANESQVVIAGSLYLIGEALRLLDPAFQGIEAELNESFSATVKAITFDVGGTLIEPWPSVGHVYQIVAQRHGIEASSDLLNERFAAAWRAKKNFSYQKAEWAALVDQTFKGLSSQAPSASFFPELWHEFLHPEAWRVFPDVRPALDRLRAAGFRLAIISNWDERLRPLLRALDLEKYFEVIVVSVEFGRHKPDRAIFAEAARQLGIPARCVLHVGDGRSEDFDGAKDAGFQASLLERSGRPPDPSRYLPPNTVSSLDELADKMVLAKGKQS